MQDASLIGLDWGSSHLRAYLLGRDGAVLDVRTSDAGASRLGASAAAADRPALFERQLRAAIPDWLALGKPVVSCGMVGSAHGWCEAPYVPCPVELGELERHLTRVLGSDGLELWIVPGLSHRPAGEAPDVMRGEETKVVGAILQEPAWAAGASILMPGTHSKWVRVVEGKLVSFATRMTGELFAVLRSHSILSRSLADAPAFDRDAFDQGLAASRDTRGGDLSHLLFGVRTLQLFSERTPAALTDYLSGLLVGHEIASALAEAPGSLPLVLVGDERLCDRYHQGLKLFGREPAAVLVDSAALGLAGIARSRGLV